MPAGSLAAKDRSRVAVINERLLRECIFIQPPPGAEDDRAKTRSLIDRGGAGGGDRGQDRARALAQAAELHTVQVLMCSYRAIVRIDNLVGVDNLVRLHLDNNQLTKIENLGHLKKLQWLDLSFNRITEIEGLDELTQLQDLSLYSNQISVVKGLDKLTALACLSLGKNHIDQLDDAARYLHKLHGSLRMLTLQGNTPSPAQSAAAAAVAGAAQPAAAPKLEQHPQYRNRLLAYLPNLKFLDNRLVLPEDHARAQEEQHEHLVAVRQEDEKLKAAQDQAAAERKIAADVAYFNCPNEDRVHEELHRLQPEGRNIVGALAVDAVAERIKDIWERYQTDFKARAGELAKAMKDLRKKRDEDDAAFRSTVNAYKLKNSEECKALIKAFERRLKAVVPFGLKARPDPDAYDEDQLRALRDDLARLKSALLELEADQYEALGSVIAVAAAQYRQDDVGTVINTHFDFLQKIELDWQQALKIALDNFYDERQKDGAGEFHAAAAGGGGGADGGNSDAVKQAFALLDNKEEYQKVLAEWLELHRKRLEEMEQHHVKNEEALIRDRAESLVREEQARNRARIGEIHAYVQRMTDTINQWEQAFDQ